MWVERKNIKKIIESVNVKPVVLLTGVRQVGKSSLLKRLFPEAEYVTLDKPLLAEEANKNPSNFLDRFTSQVIIDEVQYAPSLFRELKVRVDENRSTKGKWILTGSQQFELMQNVTESLAGRVRLLNLYPLSTIELQKAQLLSNPKEFLWKGGFPEIWAQKLSASDFFEDYIQTYLERDLRQVLNVSNLRDFRKFITLLAIRTGQLLNYTELSKEVGVSLNTIKNWVSALETTGLVFLLPPYYENLGKRLIKAPKVYFCDNGLIASLMNITLLDGVLHSPHLGSFWENMVFMELLKAGFRPGKNMFYMRDQNGVEMDFILEKDGNTYLIEAKYNERPDVKKLNFRKLAPLFDHEVTCILACNIQERGLIRLENHAVYNPLLGDEVWT